MANNKYTKEKLEAAVKNCTTMAEVCRMFGVKPFTGAQSHLASRCRAFDIDTSHFLGQGHNKGKTFDKKPLAVHLTKNSKISSGRLRKRLIEEGMREARCAICKRTEWEGNPIPLELDHINSDHWDNRLENIQIICPNCHAQETLTRKTNGLVA